MKTFEKRKCVKNGTQFKIIYNDAFDEQNHIKERVFDKMKSMEQWIARQDRFSVFPLNRYALIEQKWYAYIAIGNKYLTERELENITEPILCCSAKVGGNQRAAAWNTLEQRYMVRK